MNTVEILKMFDLTPRDGKLILIGTVVFFIFWRMVDAVIFKPFLALYNEREQLTTGASASSKHILEEAQTLNAQVDDAIQKARIVAMAEKLQALTAAKKEGAKILEDAESEVQASLKKARNEREQNLTSIKHKVMSDAESLANEVVSRLTASRTASHQ